MFAARPLLSAVSQEAGWPATRGELSGRSERLVYLARGHVLCVWLWQGTCPDAFGDQCPLGICPQEGLVGCVQLTW